MKYWWVNQSVTYATASAEGVITAPKASKSGGRLPHWESLLEVEPGDVIIHAAHQLVRAIGGATARATDITMLREGASVEARSVRCIYEPATDPVALSEIPHDWRVGEPDGGPFDRNGEPKQGYLYPLTEAFGRRFLETFGRRYPTFRLDAPAVAPRRAWIFQSNPELYDIAAAVDALEEQSWLVHQHVHEIKPEDEVFLWKTGPGGGLIALGTVLVEPAEMPIREAEMPFVHVPEKFEGLARRTVVRIDRRLANTITREKISADPVLADLPNLRFAQKSNYPVTPEQRVRLLALVNSVGGQPAHRETLEDLADRLCLDPRYLRDLNWLLGDRRQLVFYGPPGTGKTFVAEAFAAWFAESTDRVGTIQFHPSYAYEDFVEGIRPVLDTAELRYQRVDGLLKRFAERARQDEDHDYVLVIDEINRANLARVFGELLYLLEYRERSVTLPYSGGKFSLPENLYLIGTMNTADRSIALVDFALRRRFHFVEFPADAAILRRWLGKYNKPMLQVADLLAWVNAEINAHDFAIGFSYFMRDDLDEEILTRIWERSVLPALDEYYFDNAEKRKRFELKAVRGAVSGEVPPADLVAEPLALGEGEDAEAPGELS